MRSGAHSAGDRDLPQGVRGGRDGALPRERGVSVGMEYISTRRVQLTYDLPLAEIITDFFDAMKSRTRATPPTTTSRLATSLPTW